MRRTLRVLLGAPLVCGVLATGARSQIAAPCCSITAINVQTGIVSARVNATGVAFEFKVTDARVLPSLRVGQGVFANLTTKEVSLDGKTACCSIVQPTKPSPPALSAAANTNLNAAVCSTATSPVFLKVSGLQGESADACHKGEVEVLSTTANGKNFSIVKHLDSASPRLWFDCMSGEIIPQATITLFTSGPSPKKVTYTLKNAKITSLNMSAGPTPSAGTQETIGLAAAELDTLTEASTASVQLATQPPPVQISLALGAPTADPKAAGALISVNALSAQIAGGNNAGFVIRKAIDSASAQFQQAYLTKIPVANETITMQRNSGKLTFKLTNAVVTNDIQSSGASSGEQVTLSATKLEVESQIAAAH
jgi:type VI secretion system secreted protein Hcp